MPTEREYGVLFPGSEVPRDRWTTTGLRDPGGIFDWDAVFGRAAPRVADLGCGNGRSTILSALARPGTDHLGIDLVQVAVDHASQRANRRGLANVRFVVGDVVLWMEKRFAENSLDEVHIYHPQPYYEADAAGRRLLTPDFLARTWDVLRPKGLLVLQTDNRAYWTYLVGAVTKHFEIESLPVVWPDAPEGRTRREIQARDKGLQVWRMVARRRASPLAVTIAAPDFDANRAKFQKRKRRGGK